MTVKRKKVWAYECEECGDTAFYVTRYPSHGETVRSSDGILVDGTKPEPYSPFTCGSCGGIPTNSRSFPVRSQLRGPVYIEEKDSGG